MPASANKTIQNILYLQCATSSLQARAIGMSLVENGVVSDGPANPEEWPYKCPLEAVRDGWRIVQFPMIATAPAEYRYQYIPCEFILEKMVEEDRS